MAMVGALQHAAQLAADAPVQAPAEDLGDAIGTQAQQAQITGALEQPVDGEVAAEDQVAAVLDLLDGVVTAEIDLLAVLFGENLERRLGSNTRAACESVGRCVVSLLCAPSGDRQEARQRFI